VTENPWLQMIYRKGGSALLSFAALIAGTFLLIHMVGGDPVRATLGIDASPDLVAQRRAALHLDASLPRQFFFYASDVARLNLGCSIVSGQPVWSIIAPRIIHTIKLAGVSMLIVVLIGIPVGFWGGIEGQRRTRPGTEVIFRGLSGIFTAIPEFLLGSILVYLLAVRLDLLPVAGHDGWKSFLLPAIALGAAPCALLARLTRVETMGVLEKQFAATARSKHLPATLFYFRHILPNVMVPVLTAAGIVFGGLLGGSVIIEKMFAWPGIGSVVVSAILMRDYPLVQGTALVLGTLILIVHTTVDLVLAWLDPQFGTNQAGAHL
jgi:peptide/nickel transport system permease protein